MPALHDHKPPFDDPQSDNVAPWVLTRPWIRKTPVSQESNGLFHFALHYPNRVELAGALKRILEHGYPIDTVVDYGPGEAVNVSDPDGNGVELVYDRPTGA